MSGWRKFLNSVKLNALGEMSAVQVGDLVTLNGKTFKITAVSAIGFTYVPADLEVKLVAPLFTDEDCYLSECGYCGGRHRPGHCDKLHNLLRKKEYTQYLDPYPVTPDTCW